MLVLLWCTISRLRCLSVIFASYLLWRSISVSDADQKDTCTSTFGSGLHAFNCEFYLPHFIVRARNEGHTKGKRVEDLKVTIKLPLTAASAHHSDAGREDSRRRQGDSYDGCAGRKHG
jgi:hypothetical protein